MKKKKNMQNFEIKKQKVLSTKVEEFINIVFCFKSNFET
jgi:hypothetical protein